MLTVFVSLNTYHFNKHLDLIFSALKMYKMTKKVASAQPSFELRVCCQHCYDYLCVSTETTCKHLFCEKCINNYLLFLNECPACEQPLRNQPLYSNKVLDNIIIDYITLFDPDQLANFKDRLQKYDDFKKKSHISLFSKGMKVDFLDQDYVWTTGVVTGINS